MALREQIEKDFLTAFKGRQEAAVLALRNIKAALMQAEIARRPDKLTDDDVVKVLKSEAKKRADAIADYTRGNRPELAAKEQAEIEIIKKYLPAEMGDEEIKKAVAGAIKKTNATSAKDFGKVMGLAMKELAGKADGGKVGEFVKAALAELKIEN